MKSQHGSKTQLMFSVLIFLCYCIGLALAWKNSGGCPFTEYCCKYGIKSITFALALCFILACSIFGLLFLPLYSVLFGAVSYSMISVITDQFMSGAPLKADSLICFAIITPAFFVIAVHGMRVSEILIKLLCNNSLSGKETFNRYQLSSAFILMAAAAAVTFILK